MGVNDRWGKKMKVHGWEKGENCINNGVKRLKIAPPTAFMYAWENVFKGVCVGGGVLALGVDGRNAQYIPLNTYLGPPYTLEFQKLFDFVFEYYYIITLLLT